MPEKGIVMFPGRHRHARRATDCQVSALEHVANRPIAHHVLDAMLAAGADELVLAGTADVLIDVRASLSRYRGRGVRIEYAACNQRADAISVFRAAAEFVGAAPCIVHMGDGLLGEPIRPYVETLRERSLDLVLLCQNSSSGGTSNSSPGDGGSAPTVPGILCGAAIGVFGPGAFRGACRGDTRGSHVGIGMLAQQLSDDGGDVQVRLANSWRRYRGDPEDLLEVNRLALDLLPPQMHTVTGEHTRIEGRVHIDPTASVRTSVIVGPVVIGEGAEVANAYIGPYTAVGAGARIEGAEIERSIISPGARVMHVGARLVSSLVGRGAHVFRDFSLPRAMRLRVGEGDEIALC